MTKHINTLLIQVIFLLAHQTLPSQAKIITSAYRNKGTIHKTKLDLEQIELFIDHSRQELSYFNDPDQPYAKPEVRYNLALALELFLQNDEVDTDDDFERAQECANLYETAAKNETHPLIIEKRVKALNRAGELRLECSKSRKNHFSPHNNYDDGEDGFGEDVFKAESLFRDAISIQPNDESSIDENNKTSTVNDDLSSLRASAFESLVLFQLDRTEIDDDIELTEPLDSCIWTSDLLPNESIVDEYAGEILHRMTNLRADVPTGDYSELMQVQSDGLVGSVGAWVPFATDGDPTLEAVYSAYRTAAWKSHKAAVGKTSFYDSIYDDVLEYGALLSEEDIYIPEGEVDELSDLWTKLYRHIDLAETSAREAGLSNDEDLHREYKEALMSHPQIGPLIESKVFSDLTAELDSIFATMSVDEKKRLDLDGNRRLRATAVKM